MARKRRFGPQARRKMIWARNGELLGIPTATGAAIDLLADFRADGGSTLGSTVTRTHITVNTFWDEFLPGNTANQLFVGVLVDQLQSDPTEVPRPAVELHADWMYWKAHPPLPDAAGLSAVVGGQTPAAVLSNFTIDVKAQRKMEELGQTLWMVLDPTYTAEAAVTVSYSSSVLLKLP